MTHQKLFALWRLSVSASTFLWILNVFNIGQDLKNWIDRIQKCTILYCSVQYVRSDQHIKNSIQETIFQLKFTKTFFYSNRRRFYRTCIHMIAFMAITWHWMCGKTVSVLAIKKTLAKNKAWRFIMQGVALGIHKWRWLVLHFRIAYQRASRIFQNSGPTIQYINLVYWLAGFYCDMHAILECATEQYALGHHMPCTTSSLSTH